LALLEFSKYLNTLETRQRTRATFQHFDILEFVLHLMTCRCVCVRCQPPWAIKRNNKAHEAYFTHVFVAFITISKRAADCWHATPPSNQQHHLEPPTIPIIFGPATKYLSKHVAFGATFIAFFVSYSQREEHFLPIVCKSACHAAVTLPHNPSFHCWCCCCLCSLMWQSF